MADSTKLERGERNYVISGRQSDCRLGANCEVTGLATAHTSDRFGVTCRHDENHRPSPSAVDRLSAEAPVVQNANASIRPSFECVQ